MAGKKAPIQQDNRQESKGGMTEDRLVDLTAEQRNRLVRERFSFREGAGWFTPEGVFAGRNEAAVFTALLDLEEAEINAIGDCMTGACMVMPRLEDFVRKD
jgi:hypothetical protein